MNAQEIGGHLAAGNFGVGRQTHGALAGGTGLPPTLYEQAQAFTRALIDLNPAPRTMAESINHLLGSMAPEERKRTLRALFELYEAG